MLSALPAHAKPVSQQGRVCHLPGIEEGLRCVVLPVPLQGEQGPTLPLHVVIAPAYREAARPDPLFVLAGGPGEAGSDVLSLLQHTFRRSRATRDIVLIDQRGTGRSGRLDCAGSPDDDSLSDEQQNIRLRACLAAFKTPFSAYTTAHAAQDIERVRLALGYGKINLWGGSYGTRLGQAYARAYPANVRSLILDGVAAPDQVIPAGGRDGQAALDLLFRQCAADRACNQAYPNLRGEFDALVARLKSGPLSLDMSDPRTAQPLRISMDSARFLTTVHSVLYSALDSRRLPYLIHSAHQGRWAPFVARRNASTDFSIEGGPALGLHLAVVCAEDFPRLTPQLQAEDGHNAFLGGTKSARLIELCKAINVHAVPYKAPSTIAAPVLMLSGALDPVTPPHRAVTAAKAMTRSQHLVVANAGHGISSIGCAPRLLREFLDQPGQAVNGKCLGDIPAATFQVGNAGPHP